MTQVNWIESELSKHFKDLDLTVGVDLDRDGTIAGSEKTDRNGNGAVDSAEWQKFMGDNQAALTKLGGRFEKYYSDGAHKDSSIFGEVVKVVGSLFKGLSILSASIALFSACEDGDVRYYGDDGDDNDDGDSGSPCDRDELHECYETLWSCAVACQTLEGSTYQETQALIDDCVLDCDWDYCECADEEAHCTDGCTNEEDCELEDELHETCEDYFGYKF